MSKYVAVKDRKFIRLTPVEHCYYVSSGWIEPRKVYNFGDWKMEHPIREPSRHIKPMVYASRLNLTTWANDCRIVPDNIANEIDSIDYQINQLQIKRQELIKNEFLTFPIVQTNDLAPDTMHKRYATKSEAIRNKTK